MGIYDAIYQFDTFWLWYFITIYQAEAYGGVYGMKVRNIINFFNPNDMVGAFNLMIFLVVMVFIYIFTTTMPMNSLPPDITPAYRTVENSGFLGKAEYYIFDTAGNRYRVYQDIFDRYKDLPRR